MFLRINADLVSSLETSFPVNFHGDQTIAPQLVPCITLCALYRKCKLDDHSRPAVKNLFGFYDAMVSAIRRGLPALSGCKDTKERTVPFDAEILDFFHANSSSSGAIISAALADFKRHLAVQVLKEKYPTIGTKELDRLLKDSQPYPVLYSLVLHLSMLQCKRIYDSPCSVVPGPEGIFMRSLLANKTPYTYKRKLTPDSQPQTITTEDPFDQYTSRASTPKLYALNNLVFWTFWLTCLQDLASVADALLDHNGPLCVAMDLSKREPFLPGDIFSSAGNEEQLCSMLGDAFIECVRANRVIRPPAALGTSTFATPEKIREIAAAGTSTSAFIRDTIASRSLLIQSARPPSDQWKSHWEYIVGSPPSDDDVNNNDDDDDEMAVDSAFHDEDDVGNPTTTTTTATTATTRTVPSPSPAKKSPATGIPRTGFVPGVSQPLDRAPDNTPVGLPSDAVIAAAAKPKKKRVPKKPADDSAPSKKRKRPDAEEQPEVVAEAENNAAENSDNDDEIDTEIAPPPAKKSKTVAATASTTNTSSDAKKHTKKAVTLLGSAWRKVTDATEQLKRINLADLSGDQYQIFGELFGLCTKIPVVDEDMFM